MNGGWKSGEMDLSFTGLSEHGLVCTRKMLDQLQVGLESPIFMWKSLPMQLIVKKR